MKLRNKKEEGAALVEYALLIAGVALISAAAVSIFGHKTNDLVAATATILPGAHEDDNGSIVSGKIIETTGSDAGPIAVDAAGIAANPDSPRLGANLFGPTGNTGSVNGTATTNVLGSLVIEAPDN